jgi:hypothetical protein
MKKLDIDTLVKLSEIFEQSGAFMLNILIDLNNRGKLEEFFNLVDKKKMLDDFLQEQTKKPRINR